MRVDDVGGQQEGGVARGGGRRGGPQFERRRTASGRAGARQGQRGRKAGAAGRKCDVRDSGAGRRRRIAGRGRRRRDRVARRGGERTGVPVAEHVPKLELATGSSDDELAGGPRAQRGRAARAARARAQPAHRRVDGRRRQIHAPQRVVRLGHHDSAFIRAHGVQGRDGAAEAREEGVAAAGQLPLAEDALVPPRQQEFAVRGEGEGEHRGRVPVQRLGRRQGRRRALGRARRGERGGQAAPHRDAAGGVANGDPVVVAVDGDGLMRGGGSSVGGGRGGAQRPRLHPPTPSTHRHRLRPHNGQRAVQIACRRPKPDGAPLVRGDDAAAGRERERSGRRELEPLALDNARRQVQAQHTARAPLPERREPGDAGARRDGKAGHGRADGRRRHAAPGGQVPAFEGAVQGRGVGLGKRGGGGRRGAARRNAAAVGAGGTPPPPPSISNLALVRRVPRHCSHVRGVPAQDEEGGVGAAGRRIHAQRRPRRRQQQAPVGRRHGAVAGQGAAASERHGERGSGGWWRRAQALPG